MHAQRTLWRHPDFVKLWTGQTVSIFGTVLTRIALPMTALLALGSSPLQQGLLAAVEAAPGVVAGLFVGVWVDRLRRRPVMIAADIARAALLLTIPVAAVAGLLHMVHLYIVAAIAAIFTAFFDAAYPAYLPTLVGRSRIVEGNAKLRASASIAEMGGFALGGALVQLVSAPIALLVDAATFIVSACSLAFIRSAEDAPVVDTHQRNLRVELLEGWATVARDPVLRALVGSATTMRLGGGAFGAMYFIYALRDLGLGPATAGAIAAIGGIGSFVGAVCAARVLARLGPRMTLMAGWGLGGAFQLLVPLAHGSALTASLYLSAAQLVGDGLLTVAAVNDAALRQQIVPDRLLGRVSATANMLGVAALPIGALGAGLLGETVSPRAAMAAGASLMALSCLWFLGGSVSARIGAMAPAPLGESES